MYMWLCYISLFKELWKGLLCIISSQWYLGKHIKRDNILQLTAFVWISDIEMGAWFQVKPLQYGTLITFLMSNKRYVDLNRIELEF